MVSVEFFAFLDFNLNPFVGVKSFFVFLCGSKFLQLFYQFYLVKTVELGYNVIGYNEIGYNERSAISNK